MKCRLKKNLHRRSKKSDPRPLAQFYYADKEVTQITTGMSCVDMEKEPQKYLVLLNQLHLSQDHLLRIIEQLVEEYIPNERQNRDYQIKFPDEILHENLGAQLWFAAESLSAGSFGEIQETEGMQLCPLAEEFLRSLEDVRNLLREQSMTDNCIYIDDIRDALIQYDRVFAEFELSYISSVVPVKSEEELHKEQEIVVLFCETVDRALKLRYLTQEMIDEYEPLLMFTIPRLAIMCGLLIYPDGPLNLQQRPEEMSKLFRPFYTLLHKIRDLLYVLTPEEQYILEKSLCSAESGCLSQNSTASNMTSRKICTKPLVESKENIVVETPSTIHTTVEQCGEMKRDRTGLVIPNTNSIYEGTRGSTGIKNSCQSKYEHVDTPCRISYCNTIGEQGWSHQIAVSASKSSADHEAYYNSCSSKSEQKEPQSLNTVEEHRPESSSFQRQCIKLNTGEQHKYSTDSTSSLIESSATQERIIQRDTEYKNTDEIAPNFYEKTATAATVFQQAFGNNCSFVSESRIHLFSSHTVFILNDCEVIICNNYILRFSLWSSLVVGKQNNFNQIKKCQCLNGKVLRNCPGNVLYLFIKKRKISFVSSVGLICCTAPSFYSLFLILHKCCPKQKKKKKVLFQYSIFCIISTLLTYKYNPALRTVKKCFFPLVGRIISMTCFIQLRIFFFFKCSYEDNSCTFNQSSPNSNICKVNLQDKTCYYLLTHCIESDTVLYRIGSWEQAHGFNAFCDPRLRKQTVQQVREAIKAEIRSRYRSRSDMIHRLFVCISGVADQLQTNFASDLRSILKTVFVIIASKSEILEEHKYTLKKSPCLFSWASFQDCVLCQELYAQASSTEDPNIRRSEGPPEWIPDGACSECMSCKTPFTLVRRRHHCRNCGRIFCSRCSSHMAPLPWYGQMKPVRVCTHCYNIHVCPFLEDTATI
uniref:FYVE-type domain-containing protein n=1 Tax=Latimeria chalumnae TaxID=7897 RepID=H3AW40_LATCH